MTIDRRFRFRVMMTPGNKGGIEMSAVRCRPMRCPFPEDTHRGMVEFSGLSIGSMARSITILEAVFYFTFLRIDPAWPLLVYFRLFHNYKHRIKFE